jgi:hypothetical protein
MINSWAAVLDGTAHRFRGRQHGSNGDAPGCPHGLRHRLDRIDGQFTITYWSCVRSAGARSREADTSFN